MKKSLLGTILLSLILCLLLPIEAKPKKKKKTGDLPSVVTKSLVLKGRKAPYELRQSLTVEKGATLTLMPGAVIKRVRGKSTKAVKGKKGNKKNKPEKPSLYISGTLNMLGKKGREARIEGVHWCHFKSINIKMEHAYLSADFVKFIGETTGTVKNSTIERTNNSIAYPIDINSPKKGVLEFTNTSFIDLSIALKNVEIPGSLEHLKFSKCAFLLVPGTKHLKGKYEIRKMPSEIFALGNKCDSQLQIKYNAMTWPFKPAIKREWYIYEKTTQKAIGGMAKSNKSFALKFSKKQHTKYRPDKISKSKKKK